MGDDILSLPPPPADRRVAYGSDPNQFFDLRLPAVGPPKTGFPLVFNIHGGFWRARYDLAHTGHLCGALTRQEIATANLEYRRVGNEGGGWPGTFADVSTAFKFLVRRAPEHQLDPDRVLIMGHSAGGQLALCLAGREPDVRGVISLAGIVDLKRGNGLHLSHDAVAEFMGGSPSEVPDQYRKADPMEISVPQVRQALFHGSADEEVPLDFSRAYTAHKKNENVHLVELSGAGHYELIDPRTSVWKRIEETVLELLQ